MKGKLATGVFIVLIIFILFHNGVFAQEEIKPIELTQEKVNPTDGISYVFKRTSEEVNKFFNFSDKRKINFFKKLINIRLAELKFIVENKQQGHFEKATQRYFTTVGQFTSILISNNRREEFKVVKDQFRSHIPVLILLRDKYDPQTAEWRFVEDDINYLRKYIDDLAD